MWLSTIFYIFIGFAGAQENISLQTTLIKKTSQITLGFESSQIKFNEKTINGSGARASFYHAFNDNFGMELGISTALNTQGSFQNSFTSFNGFLYYNLLGRHYPVQKKTYLGDALISTEEPSSKSHLLIGTGLNQYLLNGNNGVYSASGFGLGAIYKINLWGLDYRVGLRLSQLEAAQTNVNALAFDIGIIFTL